MHPERHTCWPRSLSSKGEASKMFHSLNNREYIVARDVHGYRKSGGGGQ